MAKFSVYFEEILSRAHGNIAERTKVLEPSIIIINFCIIIIIIIIINAYYNDTINAQYNYCISNKGLLEECDRQQNVAVTGPLLLPVSKEDCKTFCPMSRTCIFPGTASPAPQR